MGNNLKQASQKSIYENNVTKAGLLGTVINEFIQSEGLTIVENILGDFVDRVHKNINDTPQMVVTGKINQIEIKPQNGVVNVIGNKWLIYQSRGVNGSESKLYDTPHSYTDKMPPVHVFEQWIREKNIRLINNEKYYGKPSPFKALTEEEQIKKVAWGMAKNVFKHGFKPRNIYSKEIPKLIDDLQKQIADFTVQSLIQVFDIKENAQRVIIPKQ